MDPIFHIAISMHNFTVVSGEAASAAVRLPVPVILNANCIHLATKFRKDTQFHGSDDGTTGIVVNHDGTAVRNDEIQLHFNGRSAFSSRDLEAKFLRKTHSSPSLNNKKRYF